MHISLIICTKNRCKYLPNLFNFLRKIQTNLFWELIVVDNGSTDGTQAFLTGIKRNLNVPMHIVFEPKAGLGRARNAGIEKAIGEIVAFTDDDCYPDYNFLNAIYECFRGNSIDYLGGRVLLYDKDDYPITIQERLEYKDFLPYTLLTPGFIQGANFSFRKNVFESALFNPLLGAGTPFPSEDIEFLGILSFKGHHGAYSPKPLVYHHHRRQDLNTVDKLMKQYDYGRGAYIASLILEMKSARKVYLKNWYWRIRKQEARKTLRELSGFVHYFFVRLMK